MTPRVGRPRSPDGEAARAEIGRCVSSQLGHLFRRATCDQPAAFLSAFRSEIDDPVGAFHHLKVVLDHDDRIPRLDQALKQFHEQSDIVEMESGGRFIEDEKIPLFRLAAAAVGQVPDELEPL